MPLSTPAAGEDSLGSGAVFCVSSMLIMRGGCSEKKKTKKKREARLRLVSMQIIQQTLAALLVTVRNVSVNNFVAYRAIFLKFGT